MNSFTSYVKIFKARPHEFVKGFNGKTGFVRQAEITVSTLLVISGNFRDFSESKFLAILIEKTFL